MSVFLKALRLDQRCQDGRSVFFGTFASIPRRFLMIGLWDTAALR